MFADIGTDAATDAVFRDIQQGRLRIIEAIQATGVALYETVKLSEITTAYVRLFRTELNEYEFFRYFGVKTFDLAAMYFLRDLVSVVLPCYKTDPMFVVISSVPPRRISKPRVFKRKAFKHWQQKTSSAKTKNNNKKLFPSTFETTHRLPKTSKKCEMAANHDKLHAFDKLAKLASEDCQNVFNHNATLPSILTESSCLFDTMLQNQSAQFLRSLSDKSTVYLDSNSDFTIITTNDSLASSCSTTTKTSHQNRTHRKKDANSLFSLTFSNRQAYLDSCNKFHNELTKVAAPPMNRRLLSSNSSEASLYADKTNKPHVYTSSSDDENCD